jgi:hypothetical protein
MTLSIAIFLFVLAGAAEGIMDTLQFHYNTSKFKKFSNYLFWDPQHSWKNKYKNGNPSEGERFPFSSTLLVGLTDAWHLFKLLRNLFIFAGIFFLLIYFSVNIWISLLVTAILRIVFGIFFTLVYK